MATPDVIDATSNVAGDGDAASTLVTTPAAPTDDGLASARVGELIGEAMAGQISIQQLGPLLGPGYTVAVDPLGHIMVIADPTPTSSGPVSAAAASSADATTGNATSDTDAASTPVAPAAATDDGLAGARVGELIGEAMAGQISIQQLGPLLGPGYTVAVDPLGHITVIADPTPTSSAPVSAAASSVDVATGNVASDSDAASTLVTTPATPTDDGLASARVGELIGEAMAGQISIQQLGPLLGPGYTVAVDPLGHIMVIADPTPTSSGPVSAAAASSADATTGNATSDTDAASTPVAPAAPTDDGLASARVGELIGEAMAGQISIQQLGPLLGPGYTVAVDPLGHIMVIADPTPTSSGPVSAAAASSADATTGNATSDTDAASTPVAPAAATDDGLAGARVGELIGEAMAGQISIQQLGPLLGPGYTVAVDPLGHITVIADPTPTSSAPVSAAASSVDVATGNVASDSDAASTLVTTPAAPTDDGLASARVGELIGEAMAGQISIQQLGPLLGPGYTVAVDPLGHIMVIADPTPTSSGPVSAAAASSADATTGNATSDTDAASTPVAPAAATDDGLAGARVGELIGEAMAGQISIQQLGPLLGPGYTVAVDPLGHITVIADPTPTSSAPVSAAASSVDVATGNVASDSDAASTLVTTPATPTDDGLASARVGELIGEAMAGQISIQQLGPLLGPGYTVAVDPLGHIMVIADPTPTSSAPVSAAASSVDVATGNVASDSDAASTLVTTPAAPTDDGLASARVGELIGEAMAGQISIQQLVGQLGAGYTVAVDPLGHIMVIADPTPTSSAPVSAAASSVDVATGNVASASDAASTVGATSAMPTEQVGSVGSVIVTHNPDGSISYIDTRASYGSTSSTGTLVTASAAPDTIDTTATASSDSDAASTVGATSAMPTEQVGSVGSVIVTHNPDGSISYIDTRASYGSTSSTGTLVTTPAAPDTIDTTATASSDSDAASTVGATSAMPTEQVGSVGSVIVTHNPDGSISYIDTRASYGSTSSTGNVNEGTDTVISSTGLVEVGSNYFLDPVGEASGPELSISGVPLAAGGSYTPIGAEQTASGYDVALQMAGDMYTVWATDSMGNYGATILNPMSGTSAAFEAFESVFQQDLNGDGIIGLPPSPPATVIETFGSTGLVEVGSNYFLDPVGEASGPELSISGVPLAAGGSYTPIGAEQTASGYDVALQMAGDMYTVWATDSMGNYGATILNPMSGTSAAFEAFEPVFQQDLNGDGIIGLPPSPPATVIETFGSTGLAQVGSNYFLDPVGEASGPELSISGVPLAAGGSYTPIGAEQTASGYDVALQMAGDMYTVWATDSMGNYGGTILNPMSGTSAAFEAFEPVFQQDLNGDGIIGLPPSPPATAIETFGSTSLAQVGVENLTLQAGAGDIDGTGNALANVIIGNEGNNTLTGGAGNDTLTGGAGDDLFVFTGLNDGVDTVTDFVNGADLIEVSVAGFGDGLVAGGSPTVVNASSASVASNAGAGGYFIFDNAGADAGTLLWDETGGSGSDAIAIATLHGITSLHANDFLLV